jgi:kinesin family protein 5
MVRAILLCSVLFQLKRLKLRRNNWDLDTYEFDEVLTEFASQKRVYEVVAKPVVEVHIHKASVSSFFLVDFSVTS